MRSVVLVLGGVIAGFLLQQFVGSARWEQQQALQAPAGQCELDWSRMRAELQAAAQASAPQAAVAQRPQSGAAPAGGQAGSGAPAAEIARTPEQEQAFKDHAALLAAAEQTGVWSEDDVRRSRRLIPLIAPGDRAKALSSVAMAINSQRLKLTAGAPF